MITERKLKEIPGFPQRTAIEATVNGKTISRLALEPNKIEQKRRELQRDIEMELKNVHTENS